MTEENQTPEPTEQPQNETVGEQAETQNAGTDAFKLSPEEARPNLPEEPASATVDKVQAEAVFTELKLQNAELKEEIARLKSAPPTVVSADDMTVRVETNSAGNVIRVAYWRDNKMVKAIWEPSRSWSHN